MKSVLHYETITAENQLKNFCGVLADCDTVTFDTEFVSEDTYRPQLCLVQVAAGDHLAIMDPLEVDMTDFWRFLTTSAHSTVVHAGREELRFCLHSVGKRPDQLFDLQIAAGLVGMEYPAAYSTLISKLLGKSVSKGETRTDWRRRPLSERQLEYALSDVIYLEQMRDILHGRLEKLGRTSWMESEMETWQQEVERYDNEERWQRVSGISGLSGRAMAIVRELWRWREDEAEKHDRPVKRILRDDLIVELARRGSADTDRIRAVRGMERRHLQNQIPALAVAIERGLQIPDDLCPQINRRRSSSHLNVIGQFLANCLGAICRSANVAPSLVGTVQHLRDYVAYRLELEGVNSGLPPVLAQGWRAEVIGQKIDDLLSGKVAVRIQDPRGQEPLAFEPIDGI